MNILIIGTNAREHALTKALHRSPQKPKLFCCGPTYNLGIAALTAAYQVIHLTECATIVEQACTWQIDIAIIGPEAPLAYGLADLFWQNGIACIGPTRAMAQVETSKIFARTLIHQTQSNCAPRYKVFHELSGVKAFLCDLGTHHYVIKPDGLTAGKGVKVAGEHLFSYEQAYEYCVQLHNEHHSFLIEEKLVGQEFSLHCFSDGFQCVSMPVVKDYKRAYCNDRGPNTGSMGSISAADHRLPFLTKEHVQQAELINQQLIQAVQDKYHSAYKGILYGSFMATEEGVKLIEFNARFGDPEALNLLALLQGDLVSIFVDIIDGHLGRSPIHFAPLATACKYAVPQGYPEHPLINEEINYQNISDKVQLYWGSAHYANNLCYTTASRTLALLASAETIAQAEQIVEEEMKQLNGLLFHRSDIGLASTYV